MTLGTKRTFTPWTSAEESLLREEVAKGLGSRPRALERLPGRTRAAISHKLIALGLTKPRSDEGHGGGLWTPQEDALLVHELKQGRGYSKRVNKQLPTRSVKAINQRTIALGITHKHRTWSAEEIDLLDALAGVPIRSVYRLFRQRGFKRSLSAIARKYRAEGLVRDSADYFTAEQVSALLGVSSAAVCRWIHKGYLQAKKGALRHYDPAQTPRNFSITRTAIKHFLIYHIPVWSPCASPDPYFFVETLSGKSNFTLPAKAPVTREEIDEEVMA